ncbi:hypothetical protein H312_02111, partial [Anncaliia algerae PRA339]
VLEGRLRVNSIFFTEGYPSYPTVAENLSLQHHIVNHNEGFVNEDGIHSNNIEGFWSYLKLEMRRQGGVLRNNIDEWLVDFTFRKRYLKNYDFNTVKNIYIEILKIIFN